MRVRADRRIDCLGLYCPLPIVRIREAIRELVPGQVLEMVADDPAALDDVRSWSARTGHPLVEVSRHDAVYRFLVRKAGSARDP
jgi:TusA-related sulfurtransferase